MTAAARSKVPNTRITRYGYIADIVVSRHGSGDLFHYIIQHEGSAEILHWGQEVSLQGAMDSVEEYLESHRAKQA